MDTAKENPDSTQTILNVGPEPSARTQGPGSYKGWRREPAVAASPGTPRCSPRRGGWAAIAQPTGLSKGSTGMSVGWARAGGLGRHGNAGYPRGAPGMADP